MHRRVLAADSLFFFLAAEARKLSLSASLERAEEALKRHARVSDGDAAIEVLIFSSVFWVDRLVLVALGRSSWWENCDCDRHIFFEEPPPGYAALWSVSVGAAVAPVATRRGSRFIVSFGVVNSAQERWIASGMLAK